MKGIRELDTAIQAYVRVNGRFYSQCFPKGTAIQILKEWREDKRVAVRTGASIPTVDPTESTFADDAKTYLKLKTSMPSYADRAQQIAGWAHHFGRTPRSTITGAMIRGRLEHLIASGASPSTANRHRTAVMDLWTVLDGRSARNPVRDVPKYPEGDGEIRALSHALIDQILAAMPPGPIRTRLRVMAWTGWPHAQVNKLQPEHLQLKKARAYVTPRRKGRGTAGRWVPLLPPAVAALKAFDAEDGYGPLDRCRIYYAFQRALLRVNADRAKAKRRPLVAHPYDLRHSFGVLVAALYKDDAMVQHLMCHATVEQTQRYIRAAKAYRFEAAATSATSGTVSNVLKGLREIGETGKLPMKTARS